MKKRILFVDDENEVLDGFRRMLRPQASEWEMSFVTTAGEASELISSERFDILVLDIQLPDKGGLELLEVWKSDPSSQDFEVVMMTGLDDEGLKRQALDLGAADLLNKPISKDDLVARLNSVLRMKAYRETLFSRTEELEAEIDRRKQAEKRLKEVIQELELVNEQLEKLAVQDPLTKLFNRRLFDTKLIEYSRLSGRLSQPLGCIMADLDHFKNINDEHGHQAGDYVLKNVSVILSRTIRKSDIIARYGGEEFVILLPNTPLNLAELLAEKLRKEIESARFLFKGTELQITISLGVAVWSSIAEPGDQLVKDSDTALYKAKELGRNRVCSA